MQKAEGDRIRHHSKDVGNIPAFLQKLDAETIDNISKASLRLNKLVSVLTNQDQANPQISTPQVLSPTSSSCSISCDRNGGGGGGYKGDEASPPSLQDGYFEEDEDDDDMDWREAFGLQTSAAARQHRRKSLSHPSPTPIGNTAARLRNPLMRSKAIVSSTTQASSTSRATARNATARLPPSNYTHPPLNTTTPYSNGGGSRENINNHKKVAIAQTLIHKLICTLLDSGVEGQPQLAWELCQAIGEIPSSVVCDVVPRTFPPSSSSSSSSVASSITPSTSSAAASTAPVPCSTEDDEDRAPDDRRTLRAQRRNSFSNRSRSSSMPSTDRQLSKQSRRRGLSSNAAAVRQDGAERSSSSSIEGIHDDPESSLTSESGGWDGPSPAFKTLQRASSMSGASPGREDSCRTDWQLRKGGGRRARRRGISDAASTIPDASDAQQNVTVPEPIKAQDPSVADKVDDDGSVKTQVRGRPPCYIQVMADSIVKDVNSGKDFVQYAIRVSNGTQSKIIYKRYSEITELDGEISLYCEGYDKELCRLAPKKPWLSFGSTIDAKITAQRKKTMERYLNAVMSRRKLRTEPLVQQFLGVSFINNFHHQQTGFHSSSNRKALREKRGESV